MILILIESDATTIIKIIIKNAYEKLNKSRQMASWRKTDGGWA